MMGGSGIQRFKGWIRGHCNLNSWSVPGAQPILAYPPPLCPHLEHPSPYLQWLPPSSVQPNGDTLN